MPNNIETQILIIGSGIAGSITALQLSEWFDDIIVITKNLDPTESNTKYAQGGIIYKGEADNPELLTKDILDAGCLINKKESVELLAKKGPELVEEILINKLKIDFSKNKDGLLDLTEEGGHRCRRIIHHKDYTGKMIEEILINQIKNKKNIKLLTEFTAIDLITSTHHSQNPLDIYEDTEVLGVYALNKDTVYKIRANVTIIATGGIGEVYLHSTNPQSATGDGIAMAYRAGARVINMEYTQFHPTTLYHPEAKRFLISESVRGEGAVLKDVNGKEFMKNYHTMGDLAPRDIVTRGILQQMLKTKKDFVYLDFGPIGSKTKIKERFPNIYNTCKKYNIDITEELVPVVPSYHFSCGGVLTDINGQTTLKRLFAVGEVACNGLHGANRLASTSLLEGLTFGYKTAMYIKENWNNYKKIKKYDIPDWIITGHQKIDKTLLIQDWMFLKTLMWNYVGPIRSAKRLNRALKDLLHLRNITEDFYFDCYPDKELIEFRNSLQTAYIITLSAWKNKKSIGSHYRED
ncbi:MAG TPA: L-aspartate oxidase [Spirochaetota bacterium]|nr:L-aspartate oxidase [Spirochaetota bacterium]HOM37857.1 L-aspartate oxidase [Spirochaetota bacterium]HPQ48661.1 L-aspartate oxidase [Spirochaetota bacterium]